MKDYFKLIQTRREFCRHCVWALAGVALAKWNIGCEDKQSEVNEMDPQREYELFPGVPDDREVIKESSVEAKRFNYHHNHKLVDESQFPQKAGSQGESKMCATCTYFTPVGSARYGDCGKIPGDMLVSANGWCSHWTKKREVEED